jgi:hypothetical protein
LLYSWAGSRLAWSRRALRSGRLVGAALGARPRYLAENLSLSGASRLRLYGLGWIAGVVAVGSLRAAELLLGPLNVLIMGIGLMAVPEAARMVRRSVRRLGPFCLLLSSVQAGVAIIWGMALLLLPEALGVRLLGLSWQPASKLLLPVTITVAGMASGLVR